MGGYIAQSFISRYPEIVIGFVSIDSTPFGNYYSKSDIWWLKQIEWMCKPFSEKMLKVSMAKQNAVTKAGRDNMLEMESLCLEMSPYHVFLSAKSGMAGLSRIFCLLNFNPNRSI